MRAINRALEGITGATIVHLCFGYAAMVKTEKPNRYAFLDELRRLPLPAGVGGERTTPPRLLDAAPRCRGKKVLLGVIDLSDMRVETLADRCRAHPPGAAFVTAANIVVAPDCGMKYLPREVAFGKMQAMVEGTKIVRGELGANP